MAGTEKKSFKAITVVLLCIIAVSSFLLLWLFDGSQPSTSVDASTPQSSGSPAPSSQPAKADEPDESEVPSGEPESAPQSGGGPSSVITRTDSQKYPDMHINAALTHDEEGSFNNITINSGAVTLKNKFVAGTLLITEKAANFGVTLENVVVKGEIIVLGGQDIALKNVTAISLVSARGCSLPASGSVSAPSTASVSATANSPRVLSQTTLLSALLFPSTSASNGICNYTVSGTTTIQTLVAMNHLTIDESGLTSGYEGVKKVHIKSGRPLWQQVTLLKGSIESITCDHIANIVLQGGSISEVIANESIHIAGGRVGSLIVNANEVTYEKKPSNITVNGSYRQPKEQNWGIGQSEASVNGGRGGRGGNSSTRSMATPKNLAITASGAGSATLSFDAVTSAKNYTVVYSITNGSSSDNVTGKSVETAANSLVVTSSLLGQENTVITFKVRANPKDTDSGSVSSSAYSAQKSVTVAKLKTPTLTLSAVGNKLKALITGSTDNARHEIILDSGAIRNVESKVLDSGDTDCTFDIAPAAGVQYTARATALGDGCLTLNSVETTSNTISYVAPAMSNALSSPKGNRLLPDNAGGEKITVGDISLSSQNGLLAVIFDSVLGADGYTVHALYDGAALTAWQSLYDGSSVTYLFNAPEEIHEGGEYRVSVTPELINGCAKTAALTVAAASAPENLYIASYSPDSVSFGFDKDSGGVYKTAAEQQSGDSTTTMPVTDEQSWAQVYTVEGDIFRFTAKALGDKVLICDSPEVSVEAYVQSLPPVNTLTIGLNDANDGIDLVCTSAAGENPHAIVFESSTDGENWQKLGQVQGLPQQSELSAACTIPQHEGGLYLRAAVTAKSSNALQKDSVTAYSNVIELTADDGASAEKELDSGRIPADYSNGINTDNEADFAQGGDRTLDSGKIPDEYNGGVSAEQNSDE